MTFIFSYISNYFDVRGDVIMDIWLFIQNQILGMKWLNDMMGHVLKILGIDASSKIGGSIQFFLYDVIKISFLLCTLIFIISYIQSYYLSN